MTVFALLMSLPAILTHREYDIFVAQLLPYFPKEKVALECYVAKIQEVCDRFPLYRFRLEGSYDEALLSLSLMDFLRELTSDRRLQAVLLGKQLPLCRY